MNNLNDNTNNSNNINNIESNCFQRFPTEFEEVEGGVYDSYGCYINQDGSFWDPQGVFFNKDGFDSFGGFYDEDLHYHPGQNWNEDLQCYMTENVNSLPLGHQQRLMAGLQNRMEEEYNENKMLFNNIENPNFNVSDENKENGMEIDNDNDLILSYLEANLIQKGEYIKETPQENLVEQVPKFQSVTKNLQPQEIPQTVQNDENVYPNQISFVDNSLMVEIGTPFKTKTSEILKQGGTPFSVKKITLTTPKGKSPNA